MALSFPQFIIGIHDPGDWMSSVKDQNKQGWVLITEDLSSDRVGQDYSALANDKFGVIVRLNNGYNDRGTIPKPDQYNAFANRCAAWVANSPGANIWIIGNEMNHAGERPGGPSDANKITPQMYADCYSRCRKRIRETPGHGTDLVVIGAVAPYNNQTKYDGNLGGDWVQYFQDILTLVGANCDAIALHAYTMGANSALITSEDKMDAPYNNRRKHFRTYQDFMGAIPNKLKSLPVFITEAQSTPDSGGWTNAFPDWIRRAYDEINTWNSDLAHQPIQCLILFRWHDDNDERWRIDDKDSARNDFSAAIQKDYRVRLPAPPQPPVKTYRATFVGDSTPKLIAPDAQISISVTLQNDSTFTWRAVQGVPNFVRFGYRWFDAAGKLVPVRADIRTALPRDVAPGQRVTLPNAALVAPPNAGRYSARLDVAEEGVAWFSDRGSPAHNDTINVVIGEYAVAWLNAPMPGTMAADQIVTLPVTFRNDGGKTWLAAGPNRVRLTYRWFDLKRNKVDVKQDLRSVLPRDVVSGDTVSNLNIDVLAPDHPGAYRVRLDLVEEGITYFQDKGSPPLERSVLVQGIQDYQVTFQDPQTVVTAGGQFQYNLTLRNDGRKTWNVGSPSPVRIGYHWFDQNNQPVAVSKDIRTALPHDIAPGERAVVTATAVAPDTTGAYRLQWSLVVEGLGWFYDLGARALDVSVQVSAPGNPPPPNGTTTSAPVYRATIVPLTVLVNMQADSSRTLNVQIRNYGSKTWLASSARPVHVGYRWYRNNQQAFPRADIRTQLPSDVTPGQSVSFGATVVAPSAPDIYTLRFDLVEEGVTWFGDTGTSQPLDLLVQVTKA